MSLGLRVWSACYQAPSEWIQQDCERGKCCVWLLALAGFASGSFSYLLLTNNVVLLQSRFTTTYFILN